LFQKSSKKEVSSSKPPAKRKPKSVDAEGSEKKKAKKKKDPNAPKRAIAPFMYFSKTERVVSYLHPSIFNFSAFMVKKI
jgi:structure-specific recognition protein 1